MNSSLVPHVSRHLHDFARGRAPIIWIQGQNCTGCSVTLLNSEHFSPVDLGCDKLSMRYQPDIMAASGYLAEEAIEEAKAARGAGYILVVEGAIPTGDFARFCTFGLRGNCKDLLGKEVPDDRTIEDWLVELIPGATAIIAVGNCAVFGGIPATIGDVTGAISLDEVVAGMDVQKTVLNVSGCPPHPDWIMGTVIDALLWSTGQKEAPELDKYHRLKEFYGTTIHDNCERRPAFEQKRFLLDWNEADAREDLCLLRMGCRGPKTHADCPTRHWGSQISWCVSENVPCEGCTEPDFPRKSKGFPK